ncbi:MAG: ribbon-helix-helix protein, CopG family [Parcubacteria group bacterium]|nr:ribbon-helix-helix protein, CopG family [Parcubacteria group bacterium]
MNKISTRERVNITLPKETIKLIDRLSEKRGRSGFLNEAVHFYVKEKGRKNVRRLLKEGCIKNAQRDLDIAKEWFHLEEEVWPKK